MQHLNLSFVTGNKQFWKTTKPFFSNKGNYGSQIKLVEKDEVLQDDDLIAKELNKLFKNAVSTLNIKENSFVINRSLDRVTDPIDKAIDKYKLHSSIILIQKRLKNHGVFSFKSVEIGDILKKKSTTLILRRLQLVVAFLLKFLKSLLKFQPVFYINYRKE